MGLMNVKLRKNMNMASNSRHLCLFIFLFSIVISLCTADDINTRRDGDGSAAISVGPKYLQQLKAKYRHKDLSEISVRHPQLTPYHHHFRHQNSHHNSALHRSKSSSMQQQQPQQQLHQQEQQQKHHHHQNRHNQSNDNAYKIIPGFKHQAHSMKKHTHHEFDDASDRINKGGFHIKDHVQHQNRHYHQQQPLQQQQWQALTTIGPNRGRSFSRNSNSRLGSAEIINRKIRLDNLSRSSQTPHASVYSSNNRSRTNHINSQKKSQHARHTTTTTTTTSTTTTTTAPDVQEKVFFDAQNNFNNIDVDVMDDSDYDIDYEPIFDTKKRSPPSIGSFDHDYKSSIQSSENFQRDDPVRSSSGYNEITTRTYKSPSASSTGDNYQLNVNNNKSTIETSKLVGDDVKITNALTRNTQPNVSATKLLLFHLSLAFHYYSYDSLFFSHLYVYSYLVIFQ